MIYNITIGVLSLIYLAGCKHAFEACVFVRKKGLDRKQGYEESLVTDITFILFWPVILPVAAAVSLVNYLYRRVTR